MAEKKKGEPQEKAAGSKLKWIILLGILLVVLGAGGGAAYYFLVYKAADQTEDGEHAAPAEHADAQAEDHAGAAEGGHGGEEAGHSAPSGHEAPIYHDLEPLTINLAASGPVRFLRIKMTVVTRDPNVITALDKHMPMIRNDLLSLLANQDQARMNTREGKDALREALKKAISDALIKMREPSWVDEILFTDFVMQ
jgi:flagellar protein FliL